MFKVRITTLDNAYGGTELQFERLTVMNAWLNIAFASGVELAEITKISEESDEPEEKEEKEEW